MRFKSIVALAVEMWKQGEVDTPILLLGPPGIGKTSVAGAVVRELNRLTGADDGYLGVIDLTSVPPEDIQGLPSINHDENVVDYIGQRWMVNACKPDAYGVLCLDDIAAAMTSVQVASRKIMLDRRAGNLQLSPRVIAMATGNRKEDKAAATTLPSQFRNVSLILSVDVDAKEWLDWYVQQPKAHPAISSFISWKPAFLSTLPSEADEAGCFATPRQWHKLGRLLGVSDKLDLTGEVASGLVGSTAGVAFSSYVNLRHLLVPPEDVLRNPREAIPNLAEFVENPDRMYAVCSSVAEVSALRYKTESDATAKFRHVEKFVFAIAYLSTQNPEFAGMAFDVFKLNSGEPRSIEAHILKIVEESRSDLPESKWTVVQKDMFVFRKNLRIIFSGGDRR